jgi:hypothetical protein
MSASSSLALHHHGKSRVRVGRVWREGDVHHMVEWTVNTMLDSDMEHAFMFGDNTGMTPTDTQKHTVRRADVARAHPDRAPIAPGSIPGLDCTRAALLSPALRGPGR